MISRNRKLRAQKFIRLSRSTSQTTWYILWRVKKVNLSLNFQQRKIFNEVQDWAKKKIKARNSNKKVSVDLLKLFITGGGGVGKSHLMKTICMFLTKTFNLYSGSPDKPKVLILAPTGVAAININGTTINSGLSIPPYVNGYTLPSLLESERRRLRNLYSEVLVVLIYEISMVSNIRLLHIRKGYVKYLAVQKVSHLQICLFLW